MRRHNECKLYGYEDYSIKEIYPYDIMYNGTASIRSYSYDYASGNMLCIHRTSVDMYDNYDIKALNVVNNEDILAKARKLYIHPSSTISRDMVRRKYSTCLNAAMADAVIIPKPSEENGIRVCMSTAIFINEATLELFFMDFNFQAKNPPSSDYNQTMKLERKMYDEIRSSPVGTAFANLHTAIVHTYSAGAEGLANAELLSIGPTALFYDSDEYLFDIATLILPKSKLVFQETLLAALGDETNTPTADSLYNIYEMMRSDDRSVRELGLKTLATLDYIHYPVSTMAVLDNTEWRLNNNYNTTAVKFMLFMLHIRTGSRKWHMPYPSFISNDDWEVFKNLMHRITNFENKQSWVSFCLNYSFIRFDDNMDPIPKLPE